MNRTLLIASLLATLALAGCQRDATTAVEPMASEPASGPAPAPAPVAVDQVAPAPETDLARAGVQPNAAGFSGKDFAGVFKGALPCADCPGIDETLTLDPDGSFTLVDVYKDRPAATQTLAGSWRSEESDTRIHLDPNSKSEADRLFAIASPDTLDVLGSDGKASAGPRQQLTRSP
jgi:copper homeostasis protein (lipoprotein)